MKQISKQCDVLSTRSNVLLIYGILIQMYFSPVCTWNLEGSQHYICPSKKINHSLIHCVLSQDKIVPYFSFKRERSKNLGDF